MVKEKTNGKEVKELTFENCPGSTYWKNKKTGTIAHLVTYRKCNPRKERLNLSTLNTAWVMEYHYSWDEIVEKFDYIGNYVVDGSGSVSSEFFDNVLSNKNLYRRYRKALKNLPSCRKSVKKYEHPMYKDMLERYTTWKNEFENNFK